MTSVPTPTSLNDAAHVPQISDARQLIGADGSTVAANWADGVLRVPGMGGAQESVATNDGVTARGLGYGNMLMAGGTVAARWPDGTLRDAAGNPFLTAITGHNVSELNNDAGYLTNVAETDPVFAAWLNNGTAEFKSINMTGVLPQGIFWYNAAGFWVSAGGLVAQDMQGMWSVLFDRRELSAGPEATRTIAAKWADGTLRDGAGNAFLTSLAGRNVSELNNDAGYLTDISNRTAGAVASLAGHNVSELTNDAGYNTGAYSPANPGHWAGVPPATLADAMDRLAAMLSNNGANPIP